MLIQLVNRSRQLTPKIFGVYLVINLRQALKT